MKRSAAEIVREYGPFAGVDKVAGVTYDGQRVWFGAGDKMVAFDPTSGKTVRSIDVAAHAGTAFDGEHLFQIAEDRIQKIDPKTGRVLATIPGARRWRRLGARVGRRVALGRGSIATGRSIRSIPRPGRFFAPSSPTVSSPASRWVDGELWHAHLGRRRERCAANRSCERERSWSSSTCRPECTSRDSSPMAAIGSSAAEERAER